MKSKDDKSEDGSDQERKYILNMYIQYTSISLCFSYLVLVPGINVSALRYVLTCFWFLVSGCCLLFLSIVLKLTG